MKKILVTGGAGFIGSALVDELLTLEEVSKVIVLDNLSTGRLENLAAAAQSPKFTFIEGDIRDNPLLMDIFKDVDFVSHQAAIGSVPRSIQDPLTTNDVNISGTLNVFYVAKENSIKRVVYAASSSTYGDHPGLPKREDEIGNPLSPYAVTKLVNELYARVFASIYGFESIGLRYFNVYGPRQNPKGPYAAVIPLFVKAILENTPPKINGDGSTSRDFTYIENVVQANINALFTDDTAAINQVYNIACGEKTTLNELFDDLVKAAGVNLTVEHGEERQGDVKHSLADISKAKRLLGYDPQIKVAEGLAKTFEWYKANPTFLQD